MFRAVVLSMALLGSLGVAELGLRRFYPPEKMLSPRQLAMFEAQARSARRSLVPDRVLGHVPVLGGLSHDELGLRRGYGTRTGTAARTPGVRRVLFLGDSATERAAIVDAIRAMHPTPELEFCNGGVGGWNPVQEVGFYFRCHERLQPDHIILTLHNNDFDFTATALFDGDTFTICRPDELSGMWPDLYRCCYLYRLYTNACNPQLPLSESYVRTADAVAAALLRLRDDAASHGRQFSVLLLPILLPPGEWCPWETESRRVALAMLERLSIPTIDLLPPVEPMLAAGCDLLQTPQDTWHPNALAGAVMGTHALAHGLLGQTSAGWMKSDAAILRPGTVQQICIDAGEGRRGRTYLVVGSTTLGALGHELCGLRRPLAIEASTPRTLGENEAVLTRRSGTLDERGRATVGIPVPTASASRPGHCLWHACVLFDEGGRIERVSSALPLVVVP